SAAARGPVAALRRPRGDGILDRRGPRIRRVVLHAPQPALRGRDLMPPMIECCGVSKTFVLRANRQYLLKDRVLSLVRPHLRESRETFWALRDIDFAVDAREAFAIIGPNGAGKSTLFRIIAGILTPTAGHVEIHGRIAPLLALGIGFHPELTGRENIYLSAALFGLSTPEIRDHERPIAEFSELGHFIDVPIKNYSAGMQMRLGFSIAAQLQPDIF